jgi:hypothetical protein
MLHHYSKRFDFLIEVAARQVDFPCRFGHIVLAFF